MAIYTGTDLNPMPKDYLVDGEGISHDLRPFRVLAEGDVKCVGEPIAMVVAESRYIAEDAVDALIIEVEPEEPVLGLRHAAEPETKLVHPETSESNCYAIIPEMPNEAMDEALAGAAHVFTETFKQHRYLTMPLVSIGTVR